MSQTQIIALVGIAAVGGFLYMRHQEQQRAAAALAAAQAAQAAQRTSSSSSSPGIGESIGAAIGQIAVGLGSLVDSVTRFDGNTGRSGTTG